MLRWMWADDSGQGMVEYAIIIALVAVALIAVFLYLRNSTGGVLESTTDSLTKVPAPGYTTDP